MSISLTYILIFAVYLLMMLGIGVLFYRRNHDMSDYILGGRRLNSWVVALSAQASDMSGWLLLGLPGTAYLLYSGTSEAIWTAIGLFLGTCLNWCLVAQRLRRFTVHLDALTLPDFFAKRFCDRSGLLRLISALFVLLFFILYTASMFSAGAKLFTSIFPLEYTSALFLGAAIIVSYTFLGGFLAVCWTDVVQGCLLLGALVISPIIAWFTLSSSGGCSHLIADISLSRLFFGDSGSLNYFIVISALGWGLGYFGQPHILPRFMAIRSEKEIAPARIIAMIWVGIALSAALLCGIFGAWLFPGLADPEKVFIQMAQNLFPTFVSGLLLTAILAAIMSTADSQLLVASSAICSDLLQRSFHLKPKERSALWISRFAVVVISLIAIALVYVENPEKGTFLAKVNRSLFQLVAFAWAGFGAAFGPLMIFALYWKRTTRFAAYAGILSGGLTALFWRMNEGGLFDVYELVPAFMISFAAIFICSLFGKKNSEFTDLFDSIQSMKE